MRIISQGVFYITKIRAFLKKEFWVYFTFIILAMIFTAPLFKTTQVITSGDDYLFHLSRTYSLYNSITSHHLITGLDYQSFFERGTAFNIFYPYVATTLPVVIFKIITKSWVIAFGLFYAISTFITLSLTYKSSKYLTKNKVQAYLFALLYSFAFYRIMDGYWRFDIGEYMALSFIPFVLMTLEIMLQKNDYSKWYWLAIGMTGIIYSHLLTAVLICGVMVARMFIGWFSVKKGFIIGILKAVGLTILFSMYQIITIGEQMLHIKLETVDRIDLSAHVPSVTDYLTNSANNQPTYYTAGLLVIIMGVIAIVNMSKLRDGGVQVKSALLMGAGILMVTTASFPWALLNGTPLDIIQFPFRLTSYTTVYLIFAGTFALSNALEAKEFGKYNIAAILVLIVAVMSMFTMITKQVTDRANPQGAPDVKFDITRFRDSPVNDYRPVNTPKLGDTISKKQFAINHGKYTNKIKLTAQKDQLAFNYKTNGTKTIVDIPVVDYKGVVVKDNGKPLSVNRTKRGTLEVTLKSKRDHNVTVCYKASKFRVASLIVSILSIIIFSGFSVSKWFVYH